MRGGGARDRIRRLFLANVGKVLTTHEIAEVAGIRDYQRRIRELRNEEGMQILSYRDDPTLRPDQYLLVSAKPLPAVARSIPASLRMEILERNGFTCQLCGAAGGDPDPGGAPRRTRLVIDHKIPISQGGLNERDNLRVLCSACNEGRSNLQTATESARNLLARIRRCRRGVQIEVAKALHRQYRQYLEDLDAAGSGESE